MKSQRWSLNATSQGAWLEPGAPRRPSQGRLCHSIRSNSHAKLNYVNFVRRTNTGYSVTHHPLDLEHHISAVFLGPCVHCPLLNLAHHNQTVPQAPPWTSSALLSQAGIDSRSSPPSDLPSLPPSLNRRCSRSSVLATDSPLADGAGVRALHQPLVNALAVEDVGAGQPLHLVAPHEVLLLAMEPPSAHMLSPS